MISKLDFENKIENYYSMVLEYIEKGKKGDAAVNIRYITEAIIGYYIEKHAPAWIYAKQIDKIEQLYNIGFLDEFSTNILHQLRKLANKGAHGEEEAITIGELNRAVHPLRKLMNDFFANMYEETDEIEAITEKTEEASNELSKQEKNKILSMKHAREKSKLADNRVFYANDKFCAFNIYGQYISYDLDKSDLVKAFSWKERKSWTAIGENIYVVFNNGKVATISKGKAYYIKHDKYGEWNDVCQIAVSDSWRETIVYGVTRDGRVRVKHTQKGNNYRNDGFYYEVEQWSGIEKIRCTENCVYGIKIDGTVVSAGRYGKCELEDWEDIEDICLTNSDGAVGIKKNGIVVCDGIFDYVEKVTEWKDIIKIVIGEYHVLGLKADGTVVYVKSDNVNADIHCCDVSTWEHMIDIWAGDNISIGLRDDGTILCCGKGADKYRNKICFNIYNYQEEYNICEKIRNLWNKIDKLKIEKEQLVKEQETNAVRINQKCVKENEKRDLCEMQKQLYIEIEKLETEIANGEKRIEELEARFDKLKVFSEEIKK